MATLSRCLTRAIPYFSSLLSRSAPPSLSLSTATFSAFSLQRLRPLSVAAVVVLRRLPLSTAARSFSSRQTSSSLNDPNPNWSNRPPKETILLDGCDFEHWLVVMEKPEGDPTRDEIIDSYIKTLAMVVGSEEEARMKIYSVSTRCYWAFGALVSEEVSLRIKELPRVRWVLPDSYLDVRNKAYGGEPFIDGQAVPYDHKYHEEWIRNNARANERSRRNDRPRNFDKSRNFERRRENMQNRDFQNRETPMQNSPPNMAGGGPQNLRGGPPSNHGGGPPPSMGRGPPQNNFGGPPNIHGGGMPPRGSNNGAGGTPPPGSSNYGAGGMPPSSSNYGGQPNAGGGGLLPNDFRGPLHNNGGAMPPPGSNYGGAPHHVGGGSPNSYAGGMPQSNFGGGNASQGWMNASQEPWRNTK